MSIMRFQLALSAAFLLGGCTKQAWYEGVKMGAENECNKRPRPEPSRNVLFA